MRRQDNFVTSRIFLSHLFTCKLEQPIRALACRYFVDTRATTSIHSHAFYTSYSNKLHSAWLIPRLGFSVFKCLHYSKWNLFYFIVTNSNHLQCIKFHKKFSDLTFEPFLGSLIYRHTVGSRVFSKSHK